MMTILQTARAMLDFRVQVIDLLWPFALVILDYSCTSGM